jgi:hypothetical protein
MDRTPLLAGITARSFRRLVVRRVPPDQSTPLGLAICSLTISAYGRAGVQRSLGETELGKIVLLLDQRCSLN